jgi:hypothetical protein
MSSHLVIVNDAHVKAAAILKLQLAVSDIERAILRGDRPGSSLSIHKLKRSLASKQKSLLEATFFLRKINLAVNKIQKCWRAYSKPYLGHWKDEAIRAKVVEFTRSPFSTSPDAVFNGKFVDGVLIYPQLRYIMLKLLSLAKKSQPKSHSLSKKTTALAKSLSQKP